MCAPSKPVLKDRDLDIEGQEALQNDVDVANVFGLSLGGMIATRLALDRPERVGRLVLASTPEAGAQLSPKSLIRLVSMSRCLALRGSDAQACLAEEVMSDEIRTTDRARRYLDALSHEARSRTNLVKLMIAVARHSVRGELESLVAPTLVLAGENDVLVDPRRQRRMAEQLPLGWFRLIANAGHDLALEQPSSTADAVEEFLGSLSPARGAEARAPH